ncbi:DUF2806 domain-containing protein [Fuerstiella marisgermanici]|uniref:Uncharacterized protein n=1 Tax=Fuerstiella marisgermanici TaxID=1891926 RepID=A0A1P8WD81_9PLAN|nr:DUF2806 domain-containing protein [Fuerstiella marisgermanici]APZ92035.1 hypothetical protein Fuma_01639 [Fuerstiella marisgermanici]
MSDALKKASDAASRTWNVIKSIGPFLIAQSESASEAYARQKARLANIDTAQEMMRVEAESCAKVRETLLAKLSDASPVERIQIQRDLEFVAQTVRQIGITSLALEYQAPEPEAADPVPEIEGHWIDRFNDLARKRNEEWRGDLLARALATESSKPGTVSPRALWLLGTLEKPVFDAFASILDLCTDIGGGLMIPKANDKLFKKPIPECPVGGSDTRIGNLTFQLSDIGVLSNSLMAERQIPQGSRFLARYGSSAFMVNCVGETLSVSGTIPTALGDAVASFYEPRFNPLGLELFTAWIEKLQANDKYNVVPA